MKKCYNCDESGHLAHQCGKPKKENRVCFNCDEPGHLAHHCRQPKRTNRGGYAGAAARAVAGDGDEEEEVGNQRTEQQVKAYTKKVAFRRGMEMSQARLERGKKEKNYLLLVHKMGGEVTLEMVVEMLDEMGMDGTQVLAIGQHPEKGNSCLEILFHPDMAVDLGEMNRKVAEKGFDYDVDHIGYSTETVHVRKIPLTANPKEVVELIRQAISPYVSKLVDILPTVWKLQEGDDSHNRILKGKLDGNYRVRFVPLEKEVIPGFIPIGPECVKAEVRYGKFDDRNLLCSNCFGNGHTKGDRVCTASVEEGWMAYVEKFKGKSAELASAQGITVEAQLSAMEKQEKKYEELNTQFSASMKSADYREDLLQRQVVLLVEKGRKFDDKEIDVLVSMRGEMRKKERKIQKLKDYISGVDVAGGDWDEMPMVWKLAIVRMKTRR